MKVVPVTFTYFFKVNNLRCEYLGNSESWRKKNVK